MNYKVSAGQNGRGGTVFYSEGAAQLSFDWEFSMTGATVFVPTPEQWNAFCKSEEFIKAIDRRQEILERTGEELCRQQTFNGRFQIENLWLEIFF